MSLLKSVPGANPAGKTSEQSPQGSDIADRGYTIQPQPSERPAMQNSDVSGTKGAIGTLGNDGTAMGSYRQPKTVSAEDGSPSGDLYKSK